MFSLLAGCSPKGQTPPAAFLHFRDRLLVRLGPLQELIGFPCARWNGREYVPTEITDCVYFEKPRLFRGVWIYQFEGSDFIEDAVHSAAPESREGVWLATGDHKVRLGPTGFREDLGRYPVQKFRVQFIGRKTSYSGRYGHLGGSKHLIVVDRFKQIKLIAKD